MHEDPKSRVVQISKRIASRIPQWTQGTGGNVSVKSGAHLWIKVTGVRLDCITDAVGLACVEWRKLKDLLRMSISEVEYRDYLKGCAVEGRPSMEAGFHSLLESEWVIHFHSLSAIWMAAQYKKDPAFIVNWLKDKSISVAFCASVLPGLELCQSIGSKKSQAIVLQNHGVVLQAANGEEEAVIDLWRDLEERFMRDWKYNDSVEPRVPMPLMAYFPDVSVFLDRIEKVIEKSGQLNRIRSNAAALDRDAYEIVLAVMILYRECQDLDSLSEALQKTLPELPTEKLRRA